MRKVAWKFPLALKALSNGVEFKFPKLSGDILTE